MAGAKKDEKKTKIEIAMAISKLLLYVVANVTVAAGAGAWRARGAISDVHEEITRNSSDIQYHSTRLDTFRQELDRESKLREAAEDAHFQEVKARLDDISKRAEETQNDIRDLRRRADQMWDHDRRNGAGQ